MQPVTCFVPEEISDLNELFERLIQRLTQTKCFLSTPTGIVMQPVEPLNMLTTKTDN